jgi:uncharacterized Tic20 family protein
MVAHLSALANFTFPLGGLVLTILIYAARQHDTAPVRENARNALNMQITLALFNAVVIVVAVCLFVALFATVALASGHQRAAVQPLPWEFLAYMGCFLLLLAGNGIVAIMGCFGARAAYLGGVFRYPIAIQFVRAPAAQAL